MPSINDAIGISGAVLGAEHLLTSMLSSPGTVRTMYLAQGRDTSELQKDLMVAVVMGIGVSFILAALLGSWLTAIVGSIAALAFYFIYRWRAGL